MGKDKKTPNKTPAESCIDWKQAWSELRKEFANGPDQDTSGILRPAGRTDIPAPGKPNKHSTLFQDDRHSLQSLVGHLYHEANQFTHLFNTVGDTLKQLGNAPVTINEWQEIIRSLFDQAIPMKTARQPSENSAFNRFGNSGFSDIVPDRSSGLDGTWKKILSLPPATGLPFNDQHIRQIESSLFGSASNPLPLGEIGFGEKWHKSGQESLQQLYLFYQSLQEFCTIFYLILPEALEVLDINLRAEQPDDENISIRSVYDFWLNALEEAYRRIINSPEYSRTFGNLVNAFVALRHCGTGFTEQVSGIFNMPTQKELDHSHQTQHELRKQHAQMREQLDEVQIQRKIDEASHETRLQKLNDEIDQLKEQLLQLKQLVEDKKTEPTQDKTDPDSDRMH